MGSKTISLKDEAYEKLKALKTEDKSFSDVVLEMAEKNKGNFENLKEANIETTVENLIEARKDEAEQDEKKKELLRRQ